MTIALVAITMATLACLGAWLLVRRHADIQQKQIKAVYFGLYFWGLLFLQVLLWGMSYYLKKSI